MAKDGNKISNLSVERVRENSRTSVIRKQSNALLLHANISLGYLQMILKKNMGGLVRQCTNWLDRFEERDFEDALYDDERPGRPPELSGEQFQPN